MAQRERKQVRVNVLSIPGVVSRPMQPRTLRERYVRGILVVSKMWEWEVWCSAMWEVWCSATWGVQRRARGKCECESVCLLLQVLPIKEQSGFTCVDVL